jgi:hypothetical protein
MAVPPIEAMLRQKAAENQSLAIFGVIAGLDPAIHLLRAE